MDPDASNNLNIEEDDTDPDTASISAFEDDDRPGDDEDRGDQIGGTDDGDDDDDAAAAGEGEGGAATDGAPDGDDDDAGDEDEDDKGMIPKSRFNQVNTRMRMAEAELERLRERERQSQGGQDAGTEDQQQEQTQQVDLKSLRTERNRALFEGDEDKVLELEEQIDAEVERRADARARAAYHQEQQQTQFQQAVVETIKQYPFLDSQSDQASKEAIDEVVEWRDFYMQVKGQSAPEALRNAAAKVAPAYMKGASTSDDQGDDESAEAKAEQAAKRKRDIVRRNAGINQPPSPNEAGRGQRAEDPASKNIEDMTDDEFDAMPDKEKAKLRGD